MKKKALLIISIAAICLLAASCSKERTCRCSVRTRTHVGNTLPSSEVRIIDINGGKCEDLKVFRYHDNLDTVFIDSLICTDHVFDIDSIYNNE